MLIALIRHVRVLAASLRRFEQEVRPVLDEIQAVSLRARERSEGLAGRAAALKGEGRRGRTSGARLRG